MHRIVVLLIGVSVLAFAAGCPSSGSGRGDAGVCATTCNENSQCDFGNACRNHCCTPGCDSDSDCANGQVCRSDRCQNPSGRDGGIVITPRDGGAAGQDGGSAGQDGGSTAVVPVGAA